MKTTIVLFTLIYLAHFCICTNVTKVSKRNILQRKKRYLNFPSGSNFAIQVAAVKAFMRIQPTGWNILEEMDFPFALPSDTRWIRYFKGQKRNKREVYDTLETGLSQIGLNGTACVKRMMCDVKRYLPWKGKSLVKDILLALFSFDNTDLTQEGTCTPGIFNDCTVSILDYLFSGQIESRV